ncbi:MAG: YtxH domain-containing protein [Chloroflexota bacterium]|nr:YtxH domain-containing protein [Anaerolineales bacterium]MCB8966166.1 YtxH domain-containing protein [Ardenticatenaceae bacterium]
MSENNGDLGAFLAGFVIGGLVGAATALILAPQSGQETRGQLSDRSQTLRQVSADRFQQYRDAASSSLTGTRERVQEVGGQVQEQARIVLDAGREQAAKVREQVATRTQKEDETAVSPDTTPATPETTEAQETE